MEVCVMADTKTPKKDNKKKPDKPQVDKPLKAFMRGDSTARIFTRNVRSA